ncbi:DUF2878 family protein [Candidatus Parcubacteria bacterium]|nr:DUF2878 family protein [Candidatus Parcubacteria bacterium]
MTKLQQIAFEVFPIILMIGLIPLIPEDFLLTVAYLLIAGFSFSVKREKNDFLAYAVGLVGITISEYFFISTGVETFIRNSLFGLMPLWLPFLWAYAFVVIKRGLRILDK